MKRFLAYLFCTAIFIIAVKIYYNYDMRRLDKIRIVLDKEYHSISFDERINAKVTKIYNVDPKVFRNDPHQVFVVLDSSFNKDISASFELNSKLTIDQVVTVGNQLIKEPNSYMFYIYKVKDGDTLKYQFELHDGLGYPLNMKN